MVTVLFIILLLAFLNERNSDDAAFYLFVAFIVALCCL